MNKFEILTKIANNRVNYPGRLSKHVKTVLRGLLTSNPMLRWGWEQISVSSHVKSELCVCGLKL